MCATWSHLFNKFRGLRLGLCYARPSSKQQLIICPRGTSMKHVRKHGLWDGWCALTPLRMQSRNSGLKNPSRLIAVRRT